MNYYICIHKCVERYVRVSTHSTDPMCVVCIGEATIVNLRF
eukprot:COSAG01_NODE_296_length_19281_cov_212.029507_6_plen_41_part_00